MTTLLVVDDDPGILKILKMRLELETYTVVPAETGNDAVKALERHPYQQARYRFFRPRADRPPPVLGKRP